MPEAVVKSEKQDMLWDKLVKIRGSQLRKRGQGDGFTSRTQWELPVDRHHLALGNRFPYLLS